jgi:ribosome maturation factor RimP
LILKKQKHFDAYLGSEVEILLIRSEDKIREFKGKLVSADEQKIIVQVDGVEKEFIHSKIACVRLYEDYNFGGKTNE